MVNINTLYLLTKSDLFVISVSLVSLFGKDFFAVLENSNLLLISFFVLKMTTMMVRIQFRGKHTWWSILSAIERINTRFLYN